MRDPSGAITMRCDACTKVPLYHVLPADGHGHYFVSRDEDDDSVPELTWTADELRVGYGYDYYVPSGKTSAGPFTAFRYELAIPRAGVVSIHEHRDDVRGAGLVLLLIGIPLSVLTVALFDDGAHRGNAAGVVELVGGGIVVTPALICDLLGLGLATSSAGYDRSLVPTASR